MYLHLLLFCYIALNPLLHFPSVLYIFPPLYGRISHFFVLYIFVSFVKFFLFPGWFITLVRTYYCSLVSDFFSLFLIGTRLTRPIQLLLT